MLPAFISKTRYLEGLQCHKLVWFRVNAKDQIPPIDASTQAIFDQGHLVGSYARKLYPKGYAIQAKPWDFTLIQKLSTAALKRGVPLFEAGLTHQGAFARFDILNPVDGGEWDLIEVKSSTEVKEVNYDDAAIQYFIATGAGLKIRRCIVTHINNQYVRRGAIDPAQLFSSADVTEEIKAKQADVPKTLSEIQSVIRLKQYPNIKIGPQCNDPYECILKDFCWDFLPKDSVFTLYRSKRSFEWLNSGITNLIDIPADSTFSSQQQIQIDAVRAGRPHIDREAIRSFLDSLAYPLYYLDFETINTALPLFDGVRPYQQLPFQYSLHIQDAPDAEPRHHSFLANGSSDPRPSILTDLRNLLGTSGSIVAYNSSFEQRILREASEEFTEYKDWFSAVDQRVVDLLVPFRAFSYYNPEQRGTASLKAVLPALTGKGYEGLPIADGETASREYLRVTFSKVSPADREAVRRQLEEYCGYDTMAMIWLVNELRQLAA